MSTERLSRAVNLPGLAVIAVILLLWQAVDAVGLIHFAYVPSPLKIGSAFVSLLPTPSFWGVTLHTLGAVLLAWVIALLVAIPLGFLLAQLPVLRTWSMSSVNVLRSMPAVALVPVVLLTVGFSIQAEILVAVAVLIWPTMIATCLAVRNVHPRLDDVANSFRIKGSQKVVKLLLPAAWPPIVVASRLALTISIIVVFVTEMIGNPDGLGNALVSAQLTLRPAEMWVYLLWVGALGVALQALLDFAARWVLPGLAPVLKTGSR